jgi:predicted glycoside hydrolase/deacetylase ChbG (UPF0249 family)
VFAEVARELGVPLRHFDPGIRFRGDFYGQTGTGDPEPDAITSQALVRLLEQLPHGITELGCHPGYADGLRSWYRHERAQEIRSLCDPSVRAAVERLELRLVSFADVQRRRSARTSGADANVTAT